MAFVLPSFTLTGNLSTHLNINGSENSFSISRAVSSIEFLSKGIRSLFEKQSCKFTKQTRQFVGTRVFISSVGAGSLSSSGFALYYLAV